MWTKSLAAVFLAFPAAVALTGLIAFLGPGTLHARTLPVLLLFFPIWVGAISVCFAFQSGLRAALSLLLIAMLGLGALHVLKAMHWVQLP